MICTSVIGQVKKSAINKADVRSKTKSLSPGEVKQLKELKKITKSMSRKGNYLDNAPRIQSKKEYKALFYSDCFFLISKAAL